MKSLIFRFKLAAKGVFLALKSPQYLLLAIVISVVFAQFIFWMLNLNLLQYILSTPNLTITQKLAFLLQTTLTFVGSANTLQGFLLLAISIVQGAALSLLVFNFNRSKQIDRKSLSGSSIASFGAIIGLGCAACGTSLITPIVAIFFAGSAYAVADKVGLYASVIALFLGLYALYRIGYVTFGNIYSIKANQDKL